jgi:NAD(P)H-nitrite reductase large subunit
MIVCKCKGVTDCDIIQAVDDGYIKYYDVQKVTQAGKTCGSCAPAVITVIARRRNDGQNI